VGTAAEILALAVAAAFWPVLLGVVVVALRTPHPKLLLASFLAGALIAAVSVGLVIIYALSGTSLTDSSADAGPAAQVVVGALCLLGAIVLSRRSTSPPVEPAQEPGTQPGRVARALERGAPIAFVAGIVLDLAPSPFALVAYTDIAALDVGVAETVAILVAFYLVALMFVEAPLLGYLVAPAWTESHTERFNAWLNGTWQRLAVWALGGLGVYLLAKGAVGLLT
jgi:hypothetical protein